MKGLVVGVDIRDLRIARTGTGTYLSELCREFKKLEGPGLQFHFFDTSLGVYTGEIRLLKIIEHIRLQVWKQIVLPIKTWWHRCDVLFCTDNIVPLIRLGYKTVPVIHDAFFFEDPDHYNKIWLWFYKNLAIPAARTSAFIVTPTKYATERIHHFTRIPKEKLIAIYEGPKSLEAQFNNELTENILDGFDFKNRNYILHVGVMDKRKNIPMLIRAFRKVKDSGYEGKLVLVGKADSVKLNNDSAEISKAIAESGISDDIVVTGYLSDPDLAKVYSGAELYVFPSTNEGFGIPILEAFKYNLPVLVANNTCLPEVGGDAVVTFDPFDVNDMSSRIWTVLSDENLQKDMISRGNLRLKEFSWHKTALKLVEIFRMAKDEKKTEGEI